MAANPFVSTQPAQTGMFGTQGLTPELLMTLGGGILSGQNFGEGLSNGLLGASQVMANQKALATAAATKNQTVAMLQQKSPELAAAVQSGAMSPGDALGQMFKQEADARNANKPEFHQFEDGSYGWITPGSKNIQIVGTAKKPAQPQFQKFDDGSYGWVNPETQTVQIAGRTEKADDNTFEGRKRIADELGIQETDPARKQYLATGRWPREDQQALTAVDKKAILDADELVQANQQAINNLQGIVAGKPGETLNDRAGTGYFANTQSFLARNDPTGFFDDKKGQATTELNNVVLGNTLGQLKTIFGAAPTEGERAVLRDLEASVDKTPEERKAIIARAISVAQARLDFNKQRADELRGGIYYKPGDSNVTRTGVNWKVEQP